MIEEVYSWIVECIPFEKSSIRKMDIYVTAKTRKEAELIVLDKAYRFFDQDMQYIWNQPMQGYIKLD